MDLREPAPIIAPLDFTRFLVSSITFKAHLREISVYFDDKRLFRVTKAAEAPKQLPIPQGLIPTSPMGFMNVKGLEATRRWFSTTNVSRVDHHRPSQPSISRWKACALFTVPGRRRPNEPPLPKKSNPRRGFSPLSLCQAKARHHNGHLPLYPLSNSVTKPWTRKPTSLVLC